MANFVLVHGAWRGGWSWQGVRTALEAAQHSVWSPTLPGLDPDDDPAAVGLRDCVDALVAFVGERDLRHVVLVGHSWGGIVAGGALPRLADRVRRLVMLNAFVPRVGESLFGLVPESQGARFNVLSDDRGPHSLLPKPELYPGDYTADVSDARGAFVASLLTPQPLRTSAEPLTPEMDFHAVDVPKTYLMAEDDASLPRGDHYWVPRFSDALGGDYRAMRGNHEVPLTDPQGTAEQLISIVGEDRVPQ